MPSESREIFLDNRRVVEDLLGIHEEHSGTGPGRREERLEVLNKSAIVFVTACWEAYVEDVAQEAFLFMLKHMGPTDFPTRVRVLAGERLRIDKDARRIWELAGDGWKAVYAAVSSGRD